MRLCIDANTNENDWKVGLLSHHPNVPSPLEHDGNYGINRVGTLNYGQ